MRTMPIMLLMVVMSMAILVSCNGNLSTTSSNITSSAEISSINSADSSASASTASTASAASKSSTPVSTGASSTQKSFTASELAKFDGKNGNAAYIAVDGVVYDVTNVSQWQNGLHRDGQYKAGMDVSAIFKNQSPHNSSIFTGVPVVGTYIK